MSEQDRYMEAFKTYYSLKNDYEKYNIYTICFVIYKL